jgi:hypothetical protein
MKIKVNDRNVAAMQAALDKVNGNAAAFTINNAAAFPHMVQNLEHRLLSLGVLKKHLPGTRLEMYSNGPLLAAYTNRAIGTAVVMERGYSDWYLISVERIPVFPKQNAKEVVRISEDAREDMTRGFLPL